MLGYWHARLNTVNCRLKTAYIDSCQMRMFSMLWKSIEKMIRPLKVQVINMSIKLAKHNY